MKITLTNEQVETLEKVLQNAIRDIENPEDEDNLVAIRDALWEAQNEEL